MSQLRKSSSAASQPNKIIKINHLRELAMVGVLSPGASVVYEGRAALDDFRNCWSDSKRFSSANCRTLGSVTQDAIGFRGQRRLKSHPETPGG